MSIHDDCTGYDLAAGVATGLRAFDVDELGRLRGVHHARIWRPGENVARCNQKHFDPTTGATRPVEPGRCDDESHGCGFWAYHDGSQYHTGEVHGVIEGYGKTTVGTKGFRAEKARIVALTIPRKPEPPKPPRESRWDRYCRWADQHESLTSALFVGGIPVTVASAALGCAALTNGHPLLGVTALAVALLVAIQAVINAEAPFRGIALRHAPPSWDSLRAAFEPAISGDLAAKVRRNYPDVKFYDSVAAMKKAHPVDKALEPTPDNDPNFWADVEPESQSLASRTVQLQFNTSPYAEQMRALQQSINRMKGGTR